MKPMPITIKRVTHEARQGSVIEMSFNWNHTDAEILKLFNKVNPKLRKSWESFEEAVKMTTRPVEEEDRLD